MSVWSIRKPFTPSFSCSSTPAVFNLVLAALAKDSVSLRAAHVEAQKALQEAEQHSASISQLEEEIRQKDALLHGIYNSKRWRLASKLANPLSKLSRKARS